MSIVAGKRLGPQWSRKMYCVNWWRVVFLGLVCCWPTESLAFDPEFLIDRVQENYERAQALTADFVQVATLTSLGRQQTSAGRVYIEKPHSIRWEYTQPEAQTILYDGALLRIYTPKRRQVLQTPIDQENRQNVALLFLAGVGKLREAFMVTAQPSTDARVQHLRLRPRSHQAGFTELSIAVNTQNYFVEELAIHDTIGNVTEIRFASLQVHQALPAQTFELVLPPQTEILTQTDLTGR